MPQLHLPMFPTGVTHITSELAFEKKDGCITYFNGHMPVFTHDEKDVATFRMITSQFCASGYAKQSDIIRAFGVTSISVKRSVKLYREKGTRGFYAPRVTRGAAVLVDSVVAQIEQLLAGGASEAEVAKKLELKLNTLQKAIRAGRIRMPAKKKEPAGSPLVASTKSERAEADCAAPMGRGATATIERLAASLGGLDEAAPRFDPAFDVSKGGVLLALPALLACGLLRHSGKYFRLPAGFYGLKTIFLLLAFMALARLKSAYCMHELFDVWRNCREDPDTFIERTRVLVLPDAKISTAVERAQHVIHWQSAFKTVDALVREHGSVVLSDKDNTEFRLMSRFVSETANVLQLVQDTLRPRSFGDYVNHLFD